ncbi:MAG TPA: glycosyltransferase family 2 protein [Polyangiaceae bacterium]
MSLPVELSVVVPTYNRRVRLGRVLAALERQSLPAASFEVIVVDDGSTDDTSAWLAARQFPFALRSSRQENGGPARARNAGVELARAALVLFLDDDVVPEPELLAEHLKSHEGAPEVAVIGTMESLEHYEHPWVAWEQAQLEKQYTAMGRGEWEPTYRQFWTGNASLPKRHIVEAGGFDPEYRRAEDIELAMRMRDRGLGFRFNPRARGLHHAERSLESWMSTQTSYGTLDTRMLARRGEDELVHVLGGNWSRLDGLMRSLIMSCAAGKRRQALTVSALRAAVTGASALPNLPGLPDTAWPVQKACSALANLLYWSAVYETAGSRGFHAIVRRGDAMRAA